MECWKHLGSLLVGIAALMTASLGIFSYLETIQKENTSKILEVSNVKEWAIVNDPEGWVNLRSQANINSSVLIKLSNGTKVQLISKSVNWYFVKIKDKEGYIYQDRLQLLN